MDKKIIVGIAIATILVIGGAILYSQSSSKAAVEKTAGAKIAAFESSFDFKNISYNGGNVSHSFKIKNTGTKDLVIANLATSCMCTTVYLEAKEMKSPSFGMPGHSQSSWKGALKPGEEGQIIVVFDPTAHGPSGIGPVSRFVSLETNDPDNPYLEFSLMGTVVK